MVKANQLYRLGVTVTGRGKGSVTSRPAGISCPRACSESYAGGTSMTLTATPSGSRFTGWGGDCQQAGTKRSCVVDMTADRSVNVTFSPPDNIVIYNDRPSPNPLILGSEGIYSQRNFHPALGGGALAHLGAYPLSLAQCLFGSPTLVQAMGTIGSTGVDEDAAFQLQYPGGVIGSFFVSVRAWAPDDFQVLGTEGMIGVRASIVRPYGLDASHEAPRRPEEPQFGWHARIRQHALVHHIAQRNDRAAAAAAVSTTAMSATVITTKRTRCAPASSAVPVKARSCR